MPAVAAALCALAIAGCGLGAGDEAGEAELTVTRDYGSELMLRAEAEISESDTVLRLLDGEAEVETRFGGGFVQSVDGLAGGRGDGSRSDWFYYVNGVEAGIGAAEYEPADGDRIWWDHRDWSAAMRVPAVVGSWPEPFLGGHGDERWSVGVYCGGAREPCAEVERRLSERGVDTSEAAVAEQGADGEIRVLVGPWEEIGGDRVASLLASGPERSGVFARFSGGAASPRLELLDRKGNVSEALVAAGGLIAALRPAEGPPTWIVSGTDAAGVAAAAELFGEELRDRYALATDEEGGARPLPTG